MKANITNVVTNSTHAPIACGSTNGGTGRNLIVALAAMVS
jgi:hypothetical protein